MAVITISRELGSEGHYIAEKVAQALGYHFADKKIIGTVLNQYGLVEFEKEYDSSLSFWDHFNTHREERREVMVSMLNQVILAMARHGNLVIMGRGSFSFLGGFADVLNVRVQAELPFRIKSVMKRYEIAEPAKAEAMILENDKMRETFIESFYGVHGDSAKAFDLVIDTSKISPDLAVGWLVESAKSLAERKTEGKLTTSIEVDPVLAKTVLEAIHQSKI